MIRRFNVLSYVRRYQWILGILVLLAALFVMAKPEVPKDLNYRYQLDLRLKSYPLVEPTAGLVEWSTERVREVYRWNLTAETMERAAPPDRAGTPAAVTPATFFIILGCLACVLIWFVPAQRWTGWGLLVFVLAGSHLVMHPAAYLELAAAPSTLIPNAAATLVVKADPGQTEGVERETAVGLKDLADRYFEQYVRFTEHRHADAGTMFVGVKRAWFGISGLIYVLPFAVVLAVLSALTVLVQTLSWALLALAPFGLTIALVDGRAGIKVKQHVLLPLAATLFLLAVLGLVLPLVVFLATFVHAMESEIGRLLIGSVFPILLVAFALRLYARHRQGGAHALAPLALGSEDRTAISGHTDRGTAVPPPPGGAVRSFLPHRRRPRQ